MSSLPETRSENCVVKELFVSSKTPIQCHLTRAAKHLELDNSVLILNGLGKSINTTIAVALELQQKFHNTIKLEVQTSTADINDILEPLNDDDDYEARKRSLSSIHIKITK
ncbi:uncharacterized protein LOC126839008 isoform X3 [Adelges cooleyi]|uniref:uncharacterized protein LOC126839008 isoform X3 n=1 Tax=Adelges cooleyi TaxID=133065 RepID=UPI0021802480|nr:uncharacterized protein LOC126839008 isoform X3 [Adelges cooleyi]